MKSAVTRVLIANRGEIALRVVASCKAMGIETITLYTNEERDLPHALAGDYAVCLGTGQLSETYLNIPRLIETAQKMGADAVHPGYGFLSERPAFARALEAAKIKLIGPSASAMEQMGDKKTSKEIAQKIGVPVIPGYHGDDQAPAVLKKKASEVGFPVLIKASAGGGGKGMRVVNALAEFDEALDSAKREAINSFGDDRVLVEKYILDPRHIEIQVMSDQHGQHFHFFERECSIQRRHQKIVEETPSTALTSELREQMAASALLLTKHINYEGAGTVEFVLDRAGKFYFLEMNTRLQVEHPITEMVTGVDLVRLQILVARGEKLTLEQKNIVQRGHAIEVRLCAEDPDNDFMPSIGKILKIGRPTIPNSRLDCGYIDGNEVTISFDPMLGKLIVWGEDRVTATKKLCAALGEVMMLGLVSNREYLIRILQSEAFARGDTFTHFVKTYADELVKKSADERDMALAIAAYLSRDERVGAGPLAVSERGAWDRLTNFRGGL
jgi:3-methylcrotonyl-CoA carboxylase alpha subunit